MAFKVFACGAWRNGGERQRAEAEPPWIGRPIAVTSWKPAAKATDSRTHAAERALGRDQLKVARKNGENLLESLESERASAAKRDLGRVSQPAKPRETTRLRPVKLLVSLRALAFSTAQALAFWPAVHSRSRALRRRQKQATEMRASGKSLREIAKATGSDMTTIKKWLGED
jgi:hypothetical protein